MEGDESRLWTIRATAREQRRMRALKQKLDTASKSEVMRRALEALETLVDQQAVILIGNDGVHRQYLVK